MSPRTVDTYNTGISNMFHFLGEQYQITPSDVDVQRIKGHMIQEWVESCAEYSDSTRFVYFIGVGRYLGYLYDGDYVAKDMRATLPKVKIKTKRDDPDLECSPRVYSPQDIKDMLNSKGKWRVSGARDEAIIALLTLTGLRASEAASLTVGDIRNCRNNAIVCVRKGGMRARVAVPDAAISYVNAYLEVRGNPEDSAPLFATVQGKAMNRYTIYNAIANRQRRAGKKTGLHNFRHTFTTNVATIAGLQTAMRLDNHSSTNMTMRYYHPTTSDQTKVIDATAVAKVFGGNE